MPEKVVHFEVIGSDAKKLQTFYGKLFDWKTDANNPMNYGIIEAVEAGIRGGIGSGPEGASRVMFYVEVDDLQAALDKAESLGGTTVQGPMDVPGGAAASDVQRPGRAHDRPGEGRPDGAVARSPANASYLSDYFRCLGLMRAKREAAKQTA